MEQVVNGAIPLFAGLVDGVLELHRGFLLAHVQEQSVLNEADRLQVQLIESSHEHQYEQVDENVGVLPDFEEGLTRQFFEGLLVVIGSEAFLTFTLAALIVLGVLVEEQFEGH